MKFRGNYTIVGKMESSDVVSPKGQIEDFKVGKSMSLIKGATVDMNGSVVKNLGVPVDGTDATTKKYTDDNDVKIFVKDVISNFTVDVPTAKSNDIVLVGNAPGQIKCSDPRVANKPISDMDSALIDSTVVAVVQDAANSIIVSKDGGLSWGYLATLDPGSDKNYNFHYVTTLANKTMIAWRKKMTASLGPKVSTDGGVSWVSIAVDYPSDAAGNDVKWVPARVSKPSNGPVYLVCTTNNTRRLYRYTPSKNQLEFDDLTYLTLNYPVSSAASFADRLMMITSGGQTLKRGDAGTYAWGGTLPQNGVLWNDIVALDKDTWIACSSVVGGKSYVAITKDFGTSWTSKEVSSSSIPLTGINYNPNAGKDGMVVVTGEKAALVSTDKGNTWAGTVNYIIPGSQSIAPVGAGFVVASTTGDFEVLYDGKGWVNVIEGTYTDIFFKADLGWSRYVPNIKGDAYLEKSGGTITGEINLTGAGKLSGVPTPTAPSDAVPKAYIDAITATAPRRGVTAAPGTTFNGMVKISPKIETVKLTIVGKDAATPAKSGRYYSEIVIVIDPLNLVGGKIQAESTEFAVISTGDLQVTTTIPAIAPTDAFINVNFAVNRSANLEVIVDVIDIEADGSVQIVGERKV